MSIIVVLERMNGELKNEMPVYWLPAGMDPITFATNMGCVISSTREIAVDVKEVTYLGEYFTMAFSETAGLE